VLDKTELLQLSHNLERNF